MAERETTNLRQHIRPMKGGAEYLDVKWRLVWLREQHPDAAIETVELNHDPGKWATFKATVSIAGGGSASGHGSETATDFRDYYEKAETKALGRALAALGFGTQFLPDDDEALSDAPATRSAPGGATQSVRGTSETVDRETGEITRPQARAGVPASEKQVKFLHAIAKEKGLSHDDLHARSVDAFGKGVGELDRSEISTLIDTIQGNRQAPPPIRQEVPEPLVGDDEPSTSWTYLWKELNKAGVRSGDIPAASDLIGTWNRDDPASLLETLRRKVGTMPVAGAAGEDRYTR